VLPAAAVLAARVKVLLVYQEILDTLEATVARVLRLLLHHQALQV
jgi:hypothetical protein